MTIKHIITPREKDLGGFSVRRLMPYHKQRTVGPWIFFDHMGPADFKAGIGIDVRPHPHINLATVTYLFAGEVLHRDSLGNVQPIHPGDINLMVAGKGITHSERERDQVRCVDHQLHGLQLWHALPQQYEEIEPAFYHYQAKEFPSIVQADIPVRVLMGTAYGITSPVKTFSETLYIEAHLKSGDRLPLPEAEQLAIYIVSGRVQIDGQHISQHSMVMLADNAVSSVTAMEEARIAVIGGEKMPNRFIEWNFVSSRKERIEQAKQDWLDFNFPLVPGDEQEFIPLPE